jgi:hypothetical protein
VPTSPYLKGERLLLFPVSVFSSKHSKAFQPQWENGRRLSLLLLGLYAMQVRRNGRLEGRDFCMSNRFEL